MKKLLIEFPDDKSADTFAEWLSGQGEQDFFMWAEVNMPEVDGFNFNYHNTKVVNGEEKYGKFMEDNTIRVSHYTL